MAAKRTVGILGASGYAGAELLRLLAGHPALQVAWAAGDRQRGQPLAGRYPGLRAAYGELAFCSVDEGLDKGADVLFLALPHGSAAAVVTRALAAAALVVVTGTGTIGMLASYGLAPDRIVVVEPGTTGAALARGSGGGPAQLLSVGTLNPGKGHEILIEALSSVPQCDWHLTCAGSLTRHPATAGRVRAAIRRLDLEDRVTLAGEVDAAGLDEYYDRADVFVLATLQETYGMAVAEALARGLPVVSTTTGAIPDLVGDEAGLLTRPGDTQALAAALARVIGDAELRARLAEGARRVRDRLPTWEQACAKMAETLQRLNA
jgi:glycosyltransferase involved in cell wall biosynthesis